MASTTTVIWRKAASIACSTCRNDHEFTEEFICISENVSRKTIVRFLEPNVQRLAHLVGSFKESVNEFCTADIKGPTFRSLLQDLVGPQNIISDLRDELAAVITEVHTNQQIMRIKELRLIAAIRAIRSFATYLNHLSVDLMAFADCLNRSLAPGASQTADGALIGRSQHLPDPPAGYQISQKKIAAVKDQLVEMRVDRLCVEADSLFLMFQQYEILKDSIAKIWRKLFDAAVALSIDESGQRTSMNETI